MSDIPDGLVLEQREARPARPSASLLISRNNPDGIEVLVCHRIPELPVFPNCWSLPGGTVSKQDRAASEELGFLRSATEESLNETGGESVFVACLLR